MRILNDITLSSVSRQIWEPAIGHLLCSPASGVIDEIWAWESVHHGDAGLINAAKASAVCEFVFWFLSYKLNLFDPLYKPIGLMADGTSPISSCIFYHLLQLPHCSLSLYSKSQPRRHHYVYKGDSNIASLQLQDIRTADVSRKL